MSAAWQRFRIIATILEGYPRQPGHALKLQCRINAAGKSHYAIHFHWHDDQAGIICVETHGADLPDVDAAVINGGTGLEPGHRVAGCGHIGLRLMLATAEPINN